MHVPALTALFLLCALSGAAAQSGFQSWPQQGPGQQPHPAQGQQAGAFYPQQGLHPAQQAQGAYDAFGRPTQSRNPNAGLPFNGHPGASPGTSPAFPGHPGVGNPSYPHQDTLHLEPTGPLTTPDGSHAGTQVFSSPGDSALYAVDWAYPRGRFAPANLVLNKFGAQPPEYIAVYRLRNAGQPPYNLGHDEMHRYPYDYSRQNGQNGQSSRYPSFNRNQGTQDYDMMPYRF